MDTRTKIVPIEEARRLADEWRRAGETVRTACGCFDPLLPGYVTALRAAAGGGRLIVAIGELDDAYFDERARAELAAALDFVDAVVIGGQASGLGEPLPAEERELRRAFVQRVRAKS